MGPHPSTPVAIVLLVGLQLTLAWLVRDLGLGWALFLAYVAGTIPAHALYVLLHECTHNLAVRGGSGPNKAMGIACDLALAVPSASTFRTYHLLHHRHLDEEVMDPDVCSAREARWVGNSWWRKGVWVAFFWLSQALRPLKVPGDRVDRPWVAANLLVVLAVDAVVLWLWGPVALAFLAASTLFALGLHPFGGRWLQEHYVTEPGQETYSYYGPGNWLSFNIGYHNEHHDFMQVPWIHLPKVRRTAREFYDGLRSYRSWTVVVLRFIFDRRLSPFSRIVHPDSQHHLAGPSRPASAKAAIEASGAMSTSTV